MFFRISGFNYASLRLKSAVSWPCPWQGLPPRELHIISAACSISSEALQQPGIILQALTPSSRPHKASGAPARLLQLAKFQRANLLDAGLLKHLLQTTMLVLPTGMVLQARSRKTHVDVGSCADVLGAWASDVGGEADSEDSSSSSRPLEVDIVEAMQDGLSLAERYPVQSAQDVRGTWTPMHASGKLLPP